MGGWNRRAGRERWVGVVRHDPPEANRVAQGRQLTGGRCGWSGASLIVSGRALQCVGRSGACPGARALGGAANVEGYHVVIVPSGHVERMRVLVPLVAGVLAFHAAAPGSLGWSRARPSGWRNPRPIRSAVVERTRGTGGSGGARRRPAFPDADPGSPRRRRRNPRLARLSPTPTPTPQPAPGVAPPPGTPTPTLCSLGPARSAWVAHATPNQVGPAWLAAEMPASPPTQPAPGVAPPGAGARAMKPWHGLGAAGCVCRAGSGGGSVAGGATCPTGGHAGVFETDALAAEFEPIIGNRGQTLEVAGRLARFLYQEKEFANSAVQSAEIFVGLDQVLDKKQWNCVGMALLYAAIGKRTGLPLQLVAGHGHVLVAYNAPPYFFIETTARGGLQPSRDYLTEYLPFPCVSPARYVVLNTREAIAMTLTQMGLAMRARSGRNWRGHCFVGDRFSETYAEAWAGRGFLRY